LRLAPRNQPFCLTSIPGFTVDRGFAVDLSDDPETFTDAGADPFFQNHLLGGIRRAMGITQ
jgi:hypothetical protein